MLNYNKPRLPVLQQFAEMCSSRALEISSLASSLPEDSVCRAVALRSRFLLAFEAKFSINAHFGNAPKQNTNF